MQFLALDVCSHSRRLPVYRALFSCKRYPESTCTLTYTHTRSLMRSIVKQTIETIVCRRSPSMTSEVGIHDRKGSQGGRLLLAKEDQEKERGKGRPVMLTRRSQERRWNDLWIILQSTLVVTSSTSLTSLTDNQCLDRLESPSLAPDTQPDWCS